MDRTHSTERTETRNIVNLTPHDVRILNEEGATIVIPPSGKVARLKVTSKKQAAIKGIPVSLSIDEGVTNVPDAIDGTVFITSSVVAKHLRRIDVLSPDTTDAGVLRDGDGRVFAVKRLQCFYQ